MRSVDYSVFMEEKKEKIRSNLSALIALKKKLPCRRPRDPEERERLIEVDLLRYQSWIRKGVLEKIGPRAYRLNFEKMKPGAP